MTKDSADLLTIYLNDHLAGRPAVWSFYGVPLRQAGTRPPPGNCTTWPTRLRTTGPR
ncbi:hypothetical protein ACFQVA_39350 [Actinomadura keratinilytica]